MKMHFLPLQEWKLRLRTRVSLVLWEMRPWKNDLSFKLKLCLILVALENPLKEETLELKSSMFAQAPMMFSLP